VQPLIALPDGFDAGLAVPLPGEEPAELGETSHQLAEWGRGRRRVAVMLHRIQGVPCLGFEYDLSGEPRPKAEARRSQNIADNAKREGVAERFDDLLSKR
jgi:hypothetical protein